MSEHSPLSTSTSAPSILATDPEPLVQAGATVQTMVDPSLHPVSTGPIASVDSQQQPMTTAEIVQLLLQTVEDVQKIAATVGPMVGNIEAITGHLGIKL